MQFNFYYKFIDQQYIIIYINLVTSKQFKTKTDGVGTSRQNVESVLNAKRQPALGLLFAINVPMPNSRGESEE